MCIYMGVRNFGPFQFPKTGHSYTFFKGGFIIYLGALKKGAFRHIHPYYVIYSVPPPRFSTIYMYGAGSVEKMIDFYNFNVHNPEGFCFMVLPDLVRSV